MILTGETEVLGGKPVPVPLRPQPVSHKLTLDGVPAHLFQNISKLYFTLYAASQRT